MTIFGKLAYDSGTGVLALLSLRFVGGSIGLAALGYARHRRAAGPFIASRAACRAFLLGALIYALQSAALFAALREIDASLAVLLLYTYPAFVAAGAVMLGREPLGPRTIGALALASVGIGLVLGAGGASDGTGVGIALGLLAGAGYAVYVLAADALLDQAAPIALSAVVCAGAGTSFAVVAIASGSLEWPQGNALIWVAGITVVSTVVAIGSLFAGLKRVGPTTASVVSTVEPVFAVGLAFLVFGETLSGLQLAGAAMVLTALLTISARPLTREPLTKEPLTKGPHPCRTSG